MTHQTFQSRREHTESTMTQDPYDLQRFAAAQAENYADALAEIRAGRKRSHWMWYAFPQLSGLGRSSTALFYGIDSVAEARAYLAHPVLGPRLLQIAQAVVESDAPSANALFGSPDDLKLRSCATLFAHVSPPGSVFERILAKYFGGKPDPKTRQRLEHGEG
jgi:uncharacterized protein (DUF1810 family)